MTLLGAGFQMGTTSTAPSAMDLSLDEVIKSRAKAIKKDVSNVDRSIATSRARRDAAVNARRGITQNSKPTQMQIETEVQKQANKTAIKKAVQQTQQKKKTTFQLPPKERAAVRKQQREVLAAGTKAAAAENVILPSKKVLKAARAAMVQAGYTFPPNYEIKVAPKANTQQQQKQPPPKNTTQPQQQKQPPKNNNNNRRGGKKN